MGLIYGGVGWDKPANRTCISLLKEDLERFPSDEFNELNGQKLSGGLYSIRLNKAPFPQEKCVLDEASGVELIADARIDYKEELFQKLGIDLGKINRISDSQLIIEAYKKWGRKCIHFLEGDFVFFLFDPKEEDIWAVRDPIGMRPAFFVQNSEHCFFSTSIKGLLKLPEIKPKANGKFFAFKFFRIKCSPTTSHIEGIYQIPMGHEVVINSQGFEINRYFEWKRKVVYKKNAAEELKEVIRKAVETRLYPDYEIGCKFSGGLDSSAVAAFASKFLSENYPKKSLLTASSVSATEHHPRDERPWVNLFAQHFSNVKTNCFIFDPPEFSKEHAELFNHLQFRRYTTHPMESKMNSYFINCGCKTVLTGWRGDHYVSRHDYYAFIELLKTGKWISFLSILKKSANWRNLSTYRFLRKVVRHCKLRKGILPVNIQLYDTNWITPFIKQINKNYKLQLKWKLRDLEWDFNNLIPAYGNELKFYVEDNSFLFEKPLCTLHPLSDLRVIKYALSMPAIEFERNGMDRSLMRRSLQGILPDKLRLRRDKGLYLYSQDELIRLNLKNWIHLAKEIELSNSLLGLVNKQEVMNNLEEIILNLGDENNRIKDNRIKSLNIFGYLIYFTSLTTKSK
jgi:asparagine synthase (glutamine-hydrolysing)